MVENLSFLAWRRVRGRLNKIIGRVMCPSEKKNISRLRYIYSWFEMPSLKKVPKDTIEASGDIVRWRCDADGSPKPTVSWRRYNVPITQKGTLYTDGYYKLSLLVVSNTGWYSCVAMNQYGAVYADFWLGVGLSPTIHLAPSNLTNIVTGGRALFACEAGSYPVSQVEWFLNDKVLDVSRSSRHSYVHGFWLQIVNVSTQDAGTYKCRVTSKLLPNSPSSISTSAVLKLSTQSTISRVSSDVILPARSTLQLDCKATLGKRNYIWYHNENKVGSSANYIKKGVTLNDTGVYCCEYSLFKRTERRCLSVYIYALPVLSTDEPSTYDVEEGRDVTLQCSTVTAKPYVTWQWTFNGKALPSAAQMKFGSYGRLTLLNVTSDDGGQYECVGYQLMSKTTVRRTLTLLVVGRCSVNEIMNWDASEGTKYWTVIQPSVPRVQSDMDNDGNAVFVIESDPHYSSGSFQQAIRSQPKLAVQIIARARMKCSIGTSLDGCPYLQLQESGSFARTRTANSSTVQATDWTWTTVALNVSSLFVKKTVSVILLTRSATVGKRAYFDDICVTWKTVSSTPPTQTAISSSLSTVSQSITGRTQSMSSQQPSSVAGSKSQTSSSTSAGITKKVGTSTSFMSAKHTGTTGTVSTSVTTTDTTGEGDQSGQETNDSGVSTVIWIVIGCGSALVIIILIVIIIVLVRKSKQSKIARLDVAQVRYSSTYNPYQKTGNTASHVDDLAENTLYGVDAKRKDDCLVENVLYGTDIQNTSPPSNSEPIRPQSSEVDQSEGYAYIVDRKTKTESHSLGYKNRAFGEQTQPPVSSSPDIVYYETAAPEEYTCVAKGKTNSSRPQGASEAGHTGDVEYASLDGTHAMVDMTHSSTEGNYY